MPNLHEANAQDPFLVVCVSDLHLSHRPPLARAREKDWYGAMRRYLRQLSSLPPSPMVPLLCCGDVFDQWNSPPELINFVMKYIPYMHAIPGQHDLPYHSYDLIKKSAFWSLVESGRVKLLGPNKPECFHSENFTVTGVPWGMDVPIVKDSKCHEILLLHKYVWVRGKGYANAPEEALVSHLPKNVRCYNTVFVGDNHIPFITKLGKTTICNVGGFMRRKSDEREHQPRVAILHKSGKVSWHKLDTGRDVFQEMEETVGEDGSNFDSFIAELEGLGDTGLDFAEALKRKVEEVEPDIRQVVLEALEENQ